MGRRFLLRRFSLAQQTSFCYSYLYIHIFIYIYMCVCVYIYENIVCMSIERYVLNYLSIILSGHPFYYYYYHYHLF